MNVIKKIKDNYLKEETLEEKYNRKNNTFDYLRVIFALFVIFCHAYPLFFYRDSLDIISRKILRTETMGGLAVIGFFILSGFMITQSILHSKTIKEFILKRIIRLYPALIVMLLITIFVFGPIGYNGNISDYFKSPSVYKYLIKNINLLGRTEYMIEGVFIGNPYSPAINGSLWSLKHEFILYIILAIFSACTVLKNRKLMLGITGISILIYVSEIKFLPIFSYLNYIGVVNEISSFSKLAMYFLIGSTIYLYKDRLRMSFKYFVFAVLVLLISILLNATKYGLILTFPYIIMYLGTFELKKNYLNKIGDFSYGLYIYSFPIQQILVYHFKNNLTIWTYILLSVIITSIFAILSTCIIDNNTKKLKDKLFKKQIMRPVNKMAVKK